MTHDPYAAHASFLEAQAEEFARDEAKGPIRRSADRDGESVLTALTAVALPLDRFVAGDGYPGMRVRTDGEAALIVCGLLGLDPSTPLANVVALQPGQHVCECSHGPHALTSPVQSGSEGEDDPYRELTDAEQAAEDATWD